jgi:hypothetical protein
MHCSTNRLALCPEEKSITQSSQENLTYSSRKESRKQTLSKYNDMSRIILDQQYDRQITQLTGVLKPIKI